MQGTYHPERKEYYDPVHGFGLKDWKRHVGMKCDLRTVKTVAIK